MAGYRALLRVIKVKPKVITPDKGEMKEAAAAAEAFYAASQRFRTYGMGQIAAGAGGVLTAADVDEILGGATRGLRAVSVPRLTQALEHAAALRTQYTQKSAVIDPQTKLTAGDLDTVTSAANQALQRAIAHADQNRRKQVASAAWLVLAFVAIVGIGIMIIRA